MILNIVHCNSTNLNQFAWNDDTLYIQFKNRGSPTLYQYDSVPYHVFTELYVAKSLGAYFNNSIKDKYKTTKLDDAKGKELGFDYTV